MQFDYEKKRTREWRGVVAYVIERIRKLQVANRLKTEKPFFSRSIRSC